MMFPHRHETLFNNAYVTAPSSNKTLFLQDWEQTVGNMNLTLLNEAIRVNFKEFVKYKLIMPAQKIRFPWYDPIYIGRLDSNVSEKTLYHEKLRHSSSG
jgi:hypothetical protein